MFTRLCNVKIGDQCRQKSNDMAKAAYDGDHNSYQTGLAGDYDAAVSLPIPARGL